MKTLKDPGTKAKERQEELNRKRDLHIKPETPEELELKLNLLRNQIGMGTGILSNEMPLFPDDETLKKVISSKKNANSNNSGSLKSNKSKKKSKKYRFVSVNKRATHFLLLHRLPFWIFLVLALFSPPS